MYKNDKSSSFTEEWHSLDAQRKMNLAQCYLLHVLLPVLEHAYFDYHHLPSHAAWFLGS